MKKLLLSLFLISCFFIARAEDVTFTSSTDFSSGVGDKQTVKKDNFSFWFSKESNNTVPTYNANGKDVRIYATGKLTISASEGITINKIDFAISSQGLRRLAPITATTGTIATQSKGDKIVTWTGSATEVTFTVGDIASYGSENTKAGQLCFSSIDINYTVAGSSDLLDPEISFAEKTVTHDLSEGGNTFTLSVNNPNDLDVTYSSSNEAVATVDENGTVTVLAKGTTEISAKTEANDTYKAGSAKYTLNVTMGSKMDNIAAFLAFADATTEVTFKNPVTAIYQNGSNLFVKDESGYMLVYGTIGQTYANGDIIPAGFKGYYKNYKNLPELENPSGFEAGTPGTAVEPKVVTVKDLANEPLNSYLEIHGATIAGTKISDDTASDFTLYNTLMTLKEGTELTVRGFISIYNANRQFLPIEIIEKELIDPELSFGITEKTVDLADGVTAYELPVTLPEGLVATYASSDNAVATVDANGAVTILGTGTTVISAKTSATHTYKAGKAEYKLTVIHSHLTEPELSFGITEKTVDLADGVTTYDLPVTLPEGLVATYASSNEAVATVDANGTVTILAKGTTVISATTPADATYDSGKAEYTLTVVNTDAVESVVLTGDSFKGFTTTYKEYSASDDYADYVLVAYKSSGMQLNNKSMASGIVGNSKNKKYVVRSISVEYSGTKRDLGVYGSKTEYNNVEALKGETNIGTITENSTTFEFPEESRYTSFGLTPTVSSGATQISSITIVWKEAVAAPVIMTAPGIYSGSVEVAIEAADDAVIRYSINDGEEQLYDGAFELTETAKVTAYATKKGALASEKVSASYIVTSADATAQVVFDFMNGTGLKELVRGEDGATSVAELTSSDVTDKELTTEQSNVSIRVSEGADKPYIAGHLKAHHESYITFTSYNNNPIVGIVINGKELHNIAFDSHIAAAEVQPMSIGRRNVTATSNKAEYTAPEGGASQVVLKVNDAPAEIHSVEIETLNNPTGVEIIDAAAAAPARYYNLHGVEVSGNLAPGLYIIKSGNTASKVLVK